MSPVSRPGIKFAAALTSMQSGEGGHYEIKVLQAGAAVALVLADAGLGNCDDQNVLVAAINGLGRARVRWEAGVAAILDAETWTLLHKAVYVIEKQQAVASPEEKQHALELVLDRVMNQRKAA